MYQASYENVQENDLSKIADDLLLYVRENNLNIILLKGELGAGKTTLTKKIAKRLGIKCNVSSPTFVIMREYEINNDYNFDKLIHIDAYRMHDEKDLRVFDLNDVLKNKSSLVVIEWPDRFEKLLSKFDYIECNLNIKDDKIRNITVVGV